MSLLTRLNWYFVQMGLPASRLTSLDEHAWQLPSVVSNFADEMLADVMQQKLHTDLHSDAGGCVPEAVVGEVCRNCDALRAGCCAGGWTKRARRWALLSTR